MAKDPTDLEVLWSMQGMSPQSLIPHRRIPRPPHVRRQARPAAKTSPSRTIKRPTDLDILRGMQFQQYTYGNTWLFDATPFIVLGIISVLTGLAAFALLR